ncbi:high mobility group nucleosome-binding domain-containing protein 5-like [Venturia canescens]|uniref:high mobility group nucleosome-binding domain-containing protein 5-like n=1 Tax=Venturia canescens TaxID=32260 RepID=UPI001C9BC368|nr:high mobility group nucleosome-binding domain-containing protein 5-like [Venturia canescens]
MKMSRGLDLLLILSFILQGSSFRLGYYINSRHERAPDENDENSMKIHRESLTMELFRPKYLTERTVNDKKKEFGSSEKNDKHPDCFSVDGAKAESRYARAVNRRLPFKWHKKKRQLTEATNSIQRPILSNLMSRNRKLGEYSAYKLTLPTRTKRSWTFSDDAEPVESQGDAEPTENIQSADDSTTESSAGAEEKEEQKEEVVEEEKKKDENGVTGVTPEVSGGVATTLRTDTESDKVDKEDDKTEEDEDKKMVSTKIPDASDYQDEHEEYDEDGKGFTTTKPIALDKEEDEYDEKKKDNEEDEELEDLKETHDHDKEEIEEDDELPPSLDKQDFGNGEETDKEDEGGYDGEVDEEKEDDEEFEVAGEPDAADEDEKADDYGDGLDKTDDHLNENHEVEDEDEEEDMKGIGEQENELEEDEQEEIEEDKQEEIEKDEDEDEEEIDEQEDNEEEKEDDEDDEEVEGEGEEDTLEEDDEADHKPSDDLETEEEYLSIISPEGIYNFLVSVKDIIVNAGDYLISLILRDMKSGLRQSRIHEKFEKQLKKLADSRQVNSQKVINILAKKIRKQFGRSYELELVRFLKQLRDNFKS